MLNFVRSLSLGLLVGICAQTADAAEGKEGFGKPALIATADLAGFDALPEDRRKLIEGAIAVAKDLPWLPYTPRGADPSQGGFDCSGAMYFVLRKHRGNAGSVARCKQPHEDMNGLISLFFPNSMHLESGGCPDRCAGAQSL